MKKQKFQEITAVLYTCSTADFNKKLLEQISIKDLVELVLKSNDEKAEFRAAWALEHLLVSHTDLLQAHKKDVLDIYICINNWSTSRSVSKIIIELLKHPLQYTFHIDEDISGLLLDRTFKILEDKNCPIAVRCNAYDILLHIGFHEKWVLSELKTQIYFDLEKSPSPALTSRAKRILKKLERHT